MLPTQADPNNKPIVLVTGAAGKIGRYVTKELLKQGFAVRGLTTKAASVDQVSHDIEWRSVDFMRSLDFKSHVADCAGVVHLAAEIVDQSRMQRVNVEATQAIARAAEAAGVGVFCYISSAAVYGSSLRRLVTESSPTVTPAAEVTGEHWAPPAVRLYARTKLLGERHVTEEARGMKVIVVRPTVVVDVADVRKLAKRNRLRKLLVGRRHAHHVYVADVAAAIAWLVHRAILNRPGVEPVEVYNVAEDDVDCRSYDDIFKELPSLDESNRWTLSLPSFVDRLVEFTRYGSLPFRYSLAQMMFSGKRLEEQGFQFPYGLQHLYRLMAEGPRRSA